MIGCMYFFPRFYNPNVFHKTPDMALWCTDCWNRVLHPARSARDRRRSWRSLCILERRTGYDSCGFDVLRSRCSFQQKNHPTTNTSKSNTYKKKRKRQKTLSFTNRLGLGYYKFCCLDAPQFLDDFGVPRVEGGLFWLLAVSRGQRQGMLHQGCFCCTFLLGLRYNINLCGKK